MRPQHFSACQFLVRLLAVLWLCSPVPARSVRAESASFNPPGPTDPVELAAFLDDFITAQMETYQIPGAAVAVVKDGTLFFAKGYGYTDSKRRIPVVADRTLFHVGSITKLFTWTAVMQLVEAGQLDLHTDVNTYLKDVRIPDTYPEPITLFNLLTHTPGFEDQLSHLFRIGKNDGLPLDEYVARRMPARVMPPGKYIAYSNYGAALAGYIIQQVTGVPYEQYIEEHLLEPLSMRRSTIRQPVPEAWQADLALGHYQGVRQPLPLHEYFPSAPVVGLTATVTDIAKFMIAHLQDGRYGDVRILQKATAQEMHRQQFTNDPRLPGVTYGFVEWQRNGQRMLWHGGSTGFFESMLFILPEQNVGAYIVYNRKSPDDPGRQFRQAFMDHYYPIAVSAPQPMAHYRERVKQYAGAYRDIRWAHTTADKLIYMFTRYNRVTTTPEGYLQLDGTTYVEVEPRVFHEVDGQGVLIFHADDNGRIARGFYDFDPHKVFIRLAWYQTRGFHLGIAALCGIVFLSALLQRPRGRVPDSMSWLMAESQHLFRWLSAVNLLYPVGMLFVGITVLIDAIPDFSFLAPIFVLALLLPLAVALPVIVVTWRGRYWTPGRRVHYTLVVLAALVFAWWLNYWNLLRLWRF